MSKLSLPAFLLTIATGAAACQPIDGGAAVAAELERPAAHVDSIFPIDEEIRRFRSQLGEEVRELSGGASSRDELIKRFVAGLEAQDVQTLESMRITAAEFIDLYYPHTRFTSRPYEMAPQLVWFQLENYGAKGLNRALGRFGGRPVRLDGYRCEQDDAKGPNRLHGGCTLDVVAEEGEVRTVSLFGQILERDGTYKFISYANGL
jgi:hypothetical protein